MARLTGKSSQEKQVRSIDEFIVSATLERGPSQDQVGVWEEVGQQGRWIGLELKAASLCPPDFL